jgi:Carbohydrate-binding family 9
MHAPKPVEVRCPKTGPWNLSTLDGLASPWSQCVRLSLVDCVTGRIPRWGTEVRLGWEEEALHGLFLCQDPDIWATMTRRDDSLWEEEVVEIFVDPFGDSSSYFEFEINPLNTVLDLFIRRTRTGLRKEFAWKCEGFATACGRLSFGWVAAFRIPFRALGDCHPLRCPSWRANFARIERPKQEKPELTAWSPTFVKSFHEPQCFGFLRFDLGAKNPGQ